MNNGTEILIAELEKLLKGGTAHIGLKGALAGLPENLQGERPHHLPYSIWQLVEHIRIAQWDMLQFSKDANYESPNWPDEYWVKEVAPTDQQTWQKSVGQIENDLEEFISLLKDEDLFAVIPHGDGQTILREALQIADHAAYHIAEIVVIRRLLGAWKS